MKCIMADDGEEFNLFTVGTIVYCRTCFNQEYEGEVVAFDFQTKILILKCPSTSGKSNVNDVHMINLDFVEDVIVKKEASISTANGNTGLVPLNIEKLTGRAKLHIRDRQRLVAALSSGVSHDGIKLFMAITKTISEVTWHGKNIVVMNQVSITPPYRPENCKSTGKTESEALNHVRNMVEKYIKDQAQPSTTQAQQSQSKPHVLQS